MADAVSKTRIARDPETGKNYKVDGNMTFEQWQASLTPEQKAAMETHVKEARTKETKAVDNSGGSDIIELNRTAKRKEANQGAFQNLEIPMQKRYVLRTADKYGISTKGLTIKIQRNEKLLSMSLYGSTDYKNIGRIDLFPNAFQNENELVKTVLHEKCHVMQLQKHGENYVQGNIDLMEQQAERFERFYYSIVKKRVR